jgi:hypothetical protein
MEPISEKLHDIITILKDSVSFADWGAVEQAIKELKHIADSDEFDDEFEDLDDYDDDSDY